MALDQTSAWKPDVTVSPLHFGSLVTGKKKKAFKTSTIQLQWALNVRNNVIFFFLQTIYKKKNTDSLTTLPAQWDTILAKSKKKNKKKSARLISTTNQRYQKWEKDSSEERSFKRCLFKCHLSACGCIALRTTLPESPAPPIKSIYNEKGKNNKVLLGFTAQ